jgi:histidine kinase
MIDYFRQHLGSKLFLSYLLIILVGIVVLVLATRFTAPTAYNRHLGMMEQIGENGDMMGMMGGQSGGGQGLRRGQGSGFASELYINFQESFQEALIWAAIAAGIVALGVSLILSQRVVTPVREMTSASQYIADGNYEERVQDRSADELGQLARSFNQMAEKLQQAETLRRQLIGDVAHELRTPLTSIKGSMEGLMDGVLPASSETFQQIHDEAERLNRLVTDLQELNRVEAGAFELALGTVQISDLVKTVFKRFDQQYKEKGVELTSAIPADLAPVQIDENRIIQVLTNLIGNAFRYTPEGGQVNVGAVQTGSNVQITVKDTGLGIPEEHLPHIFTRFYRVDKSRSRSAGGSGIGLTIARHILEAHGGQIRVDSAGVNQGSTFTFTLPVVN